jgi:phosphate uptake regulator
MKRKIIRQAGGAFTMTLPIDWVRANKLSEKSEVEVVTEGRTLTVSNGGSVSNKKTRLDADSFSSKNLYRYVNALYALGYDEIEIYSKKDISSSLIKLLNSLIGYVLVSSEGERYVIKDIGGGCNSDLDEVFKRAFQSVLLFYDSAIRDIFGKKEETKESLRVRDLEVNKLCLYLQRAINKMSYSNPVRGRVLFSYSVNLEQLGDEVCRLWRYSIDDKRLANISSKKMLELSKSCLESSFDLFYSPNSSRLEALYELREKLRREIGSFKIPNKLTYQALRVAEGAVDLSHLTLMMNLE